MEENENVAPNDATLIVPRTDGEYQFPSSIDPITQIKQRFRQGDYRLTSNEQIIWDNYLNQNSTSEIRHRKDGSTEVGMNGSMLGWSPERFWMECAIGKPAFAAVDYLLNPALKFASRGLANGFYKGLRYVPGTIGTTIRHNVASRALSNTLSAPLTRDIVETSIKTALSNPTKSGPLGNGLIIQNGKIIDQYGTELADITAAPFKIGNEWYNFSNQSLLQRIGITANRKKVPRKFKSELDWSPASWFKGREWTKEEAEELESHIPEYLNIEKIAKRNGNWLKMPDGSIWEGDPRSWVQLMSQNGRTLIPERHFTGASGSPTFNRASSWPTYTGRTYAGDSREAVAEYARFGKNGDKPPITEEQYQQELNNLLGPGGLLHDADPESLWYKKVMYDLESQRLYGQGNIEGGGTIFEWTYPKDIPTYQFDAKGNHWYDINGMKMDEFVLNNEKNGYPITQVSNIIDNSMGTPMTETIVSETVPRKSLIGNTGEFNLDVNNVYRINLKNIFNRLRGKTEENPPADDYWEIYKQRVAAKGGNVDNVKHYDLTNENDINEAAEYLRRTQFPDATAEDMIDIKNQLREFGLDEGGMGWNEYNMTHVKKDAYDPIERLVVKGHETEHVLHVPEEPIPEGTFDFEVPEAYAAYGKRRFIDYFTSKNNTDVGARITQILNFAGIKDGNFKITGKWLKQKWEEYLNAGMYDNMMSELYKCIKDWDKLAEWANNPKNVYSIAAAITTSELLKRKSNNR